MVSRFAQWTLDVHDVEKMAVFWAGVLEYNIEPDDHGGGAHLRSHRRTGSRQEPRPP